VEDSLNQMDIDSQEPNAEEVFILTLRNESFINSIQDLIRRLENKSSIEDLRKRELGSNFISDNAVISYILLNKKDFYSYKEIDKSIYWGNVSELNIKGIGNLYIRCRDTGKKRLLKNVLHVPELGINIISQSKTKNHLSITTPIAILLIDIKTGELLTKGEIIKGLYYLPIQVLHSKERVFTTLYEAIKTSKEDQSPQSLQGSKDQRPKGSEDQRPQGSKDQTLKGLKSSRAIPKSPYNSKTRKGFPKPKEKSLQTLYERFGYISLKALIKIASSNSIRIIRNGFDINQYPICNEAKMLKQRYKVLLSNFKTLDYLEKVSSDICGLISLSTYQGYKYFITFLKKKTRFLKITLLKRKSEALQAFKDYKAKVENNSNRKRIQTFLTNNSTEYVNNDFEITLYEFGIKYKKTAPYIKEPNGLIERPNRTLLEKVRSLIYRVNLPRYL